jgi:hypothetical protein
MSNEGKIPSDAASTPFSTSDGRPKTPSPTSGKGAIDATQQSRAQREQPVEGVVQPPDPLASRAQQPVQDPASRIALHDAGFKGPGMADGAATVARGGVQGVAHVPMRLGAPPTSVTAPSSRSGSSSGASSASSSSGSAPNPLRPPTMPAKTTPAFAPPKRGK